MVNFQSFASGLFALRLICGRQISPNYIIYKKVEACNPLVIYSSLAYLVKFVNWRILECLVSVDYHSYPKIRIATLESCSKPTAMHDSGRYHSDEFTYLLCQFKLFYPTICPIKK